MPIVHIHGVATRDPNDLVQREDMLRRYVADELTHPGVAGDIPIRRVYWGDLGASFTWNMLSCPDPAFLNMGVAAPATPAEQAQLLAEFNAEFKNLPGTQPVPESAGTGLILAGPASSKSAPLRIRLKDLSPTELSDLAGATILAKKAEDWQQTMALIAADDVAHDPATFPALADQPNTDAELTLLQKLIQQRYAELEQEQTELLLQGPGWLVDIKDRLTEALTRSDQTAGFALTRAMNRFRPGLNRAAMLFFGDVFAYLTHRGTPSQPGEIMQRLLKKLREAHDLQQQRHGEPIVVLTHSMGGQIMYDALTHFLPNMPAYQDIKIDFWCATASQVGIFEEMKLFAESSDAFSFANGRKVPLPPAAHLGHWWNVYDLNDYLSYTAKPVFETIDDESYSSGMSVIQAHGGYLQQPSFYRLFARKIREHLPNSTQWFIP